jgi:hypothetical protein
MDLNTKKEYFSYAYIKAIASVAGFSVELKERDKDNAGIDLTVESSCEVAPRFDAQVKCTSQDLLKNGVIKFPLPVKNYKKLATTKCLCPQLLIIVLVPQDIEEWLSISASESKLRRAGYWISLKGFPATTNKESVTIDIPISQQFTPQSLGSIMRKIVDGKAL